MYVLPCVSVLTMGYHVIHLMYVLVTNLRVPPMNLCIGVGTRSLFFGRNFGALFEVLCVGWMNLRLCDAYRIIMPTDT